MTSDEAILYMKSYQAKLLNSVSIGLDKDIEAYDMAIKALSAEKTAEWKIVGKTTLHYECSECGGAGDKWDKFCKHCGRKMKGDTE